jgi:prophage antirepressor-like protein
MTDIIDFNQSAAMQKMFPEFSSLVVYGTIDDPLFPCQQVLDMLQITKIHFTREFDEGDDYVKLAVTAKDGKLREQNMLTEQGLYNAISRNRGEIGRKFRKFIKVVLRELRLRGQVTLTDALGKLQRELHQKERYIRVLDDECERMHEKEVLRDNEIEEMRERLAAAEQRSVRLWQGKRELEDEDRKVERNLKWADVESQLWERAKTILTPFYFTRNDDDDLSDDDVSFWKIGKTAPGPDETSFTVHVWPGVTQKIIVDWLVEREYGVKGRSGWSRNTVEGTQQGIEGAITSLLLK